MIVVVGIPSEAPLSLVAQAAENRGVPVLTVNQRHVESVGLALRVEDGTLRGWLESDGTGCPLEDVTGVYARLTDARTLPEVALRSDEDGARTARTRASRLLDVLDLWMELTRARVVNRSSAMGSNGSKPYQARLIRRRGFSTPPTLVTTSRDRAEAFIAAHETVVYKSISGVRSVVATVSAADSDRLESLRWCPAQFQAYVPGVDVRVHVVGSEVFATRVRSAAVDYRYAADQVGAPAELEPFDLDNDLADRCRALTADLGLLVSGIDLRLQHGEAPVCFEVNPSPGYSYYEMSTGQPIADAIARLLAG
jgi:glutathione synthase/RimK-type ligase-like ATP-grasp enzyme